MNHFSKKTWKKLKIWWDWIPQDSKIGYYLYLSRRHNIKIASSLKYPQRVREKTKRILEIPILDADYLTRTFSFSQICLHPQPFSENFIWPTLSPNYLLSSCLRVHFWSFRFCTEPTPDHTWVPRNGHLLPFTIEFTICKSHQCCIFQN